MPASAVPILGQVKITGYTLVAVASCPCGCDLPLQMIVQLSAGAPIRTASRCASCQIAYAVKAVDVDANGVFQFQLEQYAPTRDS